MMSLQTGDATPLADICVREGLDYREVLGRERADMLKKLVERGVAPLPEGAAVSRLKRVTRSRRKTWMRNWPCPCGSGNKFKKCCWREYL